ncbi:MAG: type 2 isopentenyl-diphosphate Delta-isomerase [Polyangiaceae bacterium]
MTDIGQRKEDHLDLAARGDVAFKQVGTLLDQVQLVHDALPEIAFDEIDTAVTILGKPLRAPILIAGMTGGTARAARINRALAQIAQRRGYAFGLGSQRAMQKDAASTESYAVRDVAPDVLLLGNLGIVQAAQCSSDEVLALATAVGADAVCLHINPAMELVQAEGDRDFRGCLDAFQRLAAELPLPIVAKETGSGLSGQVGRRLAAVGVRHVDVSGAGGTSWVAVERQRASDARRGLGDTFWEWGIPTAASVMCVSECGFDTVFATGGLKSGLCVARALALGASAGGIARPVLQAFDADGVEGAEAYLERVETELRMTMLLVGARNVAALRQVPRMLGPELTAWQTLAASAR